MKQLLLMLGVAATLFANAVFASPQLAIHKKKRPVTQQHWFSSSQKDVITVQADTDDYLTRVFITVGDGPYNNAQPTGMNIEGCGNITHVNAGSSVVCELSPYHPVLSWRADQSTKEVVAYGTVEIAKTIHRFCG